MSMKSEKPIKIILYHASWCTHCTDFMPIWEEMCKNPKATKYIIFQDFEQKSIPSDTPISGFPTIELIVDGKSHIYSGPRTTDDIYGKIIEKVKNSPKFGQTGVAVSKFKNKISISTTDPSISDTINDGGMSSDELQDLANQIHGISGGSANKKRSRRHKKLLTTP